MPTSREIGTANDASRATVDAKRAFRMIGCSDTAGYAAIRRGKLPTIRVGRRVFVPVAALDKMLSVEVAPPADGQQGTSR